MNDRLIICQALRQHFIDLGFSASEIFNHHGYIADSGHSYDYSSNTFRVWYTQPWNAEIEVRDNYIIIYRTKIQLDDPQAIDLAVALVKKNLVLYFLP